MSDDVPPLPPPAKRTIPQERYVEVERRLLRIEHPPQIERDLAAAWGLHRRTVRMYITVVRRKLVDAFKSTPPEEHAQRVEGMLLEAYRVAASQGDAKAMVMVAKTLAEVTGVKAPARVDVTSGGAPLAAVVLLPALDDDHAHGALPAEPGPADTLPRE